MPAHNQIVGVNIAEHPLTEYQQHLRAVGLADSSVRVYTTALRRMFRHLSENECSDPQMLAYYRASLTTGLRGAMGIAWRHYRDFATLNGVTGLVDLPELTPYRFPHPLYPDVTDLSMQWAFDTVSMITWRELRQMGDPAIINLFDRLEQFHGAPHTSEDQRASPYPTWILTHFSRTADTMTDHRGVEKALLSIYERASRLNAPLIDLKRLYRVFVDRRLRLAAREHIRRDVLEIVEQNIDWPTMYWQLLHLVRGKEPLPVERPDYQREVLFW